MTTKIKSFNIDPNTEFAFSNVTANSVTVKSIVANGSAGSNGYILASDGANVFWTESTSAEVIWTFTANGTTNWVVSGPGVVTGNASNPSLYVYRGLKYRLVNSSGATNPLRIRVSNGGATFANGVIGDANGTQYFTVPLNAPASLYYQSANNASLGGTIYVTDLGTKGDKGDPGTATAKGDKGDQGGTGAYSVTFDTFTGNGANSQFTLSTTPLDENHTIVMVGGVAQLKSTYSVSGKTLTLGGPVVNNAVIEVTTLTAPQTISPFLFIGMS